MAYDKDYELATSRLSNAFFKRKFNNLKFQKYFKTLALGGIATLLLNLASCKKPEDDISKYEEGYAEARHEISMIESSVDNLDTGSENIVMQLETIDGEIVDIESVITKLDNDFTNEVHQGKILNGSTISYVENELQAPVDNAFESMVYNYKVKYNASITSIIEANQGKVNQTNTQITDASEDIAGIKQQMQEILTQLNSKSLTLTQMIDLIQDLDNDAKGLENQLSQINTNLTELDNTVENIKNSLDEGTVTLSEEQEEKFNTLLTNIRAAHDNCTDLEGMISQELDGYTVEIVNKLNEKLNVFFTEINDINTSVSEALSSINTTLTDFEENNDATEADQQSISDDLQVQYNYIEENDTNIAEVENVVSHITSDRFSEDIQTTLDNSTTQNNNNKTLYLSLVERNGDLMLAGLEIPLQELLTNDLGSGTVHVTDGNNTLNVNTQTEWDNLNQNMINNSDVVISYDNGVTLTINANGVTISGAEITNLSNFEGDIHLDMTNCYGATGTSSTLDHLNNLINFSSLDFSGQAIPQNPGENSLSGINFSAGSFTLNRDLGHQLYSTIGTTTVSNGDWNGYFYTDIKDFESLNDAQVLPTNLVFKFGENISISDMQLITHYEESSLFSYARTLSNSNLDYQSYGNNIHIAGDAPFGENVNLVDGLTTAGNLVNPEEVEFLCSVVADNQGIDKGSFISSTSTMHLLNIETISTLENLGVEFNGAGHAIIYSNNNSTPYNAVNSFGLSNCYVMVEGGMNCINTTLGGNNIIYKGNGFDQGANGLIVTSTPEPDVEVTALPGNPTIYMSDANVTFSSTALDIADYSTTATNGETILNEDLSDFMNTPYGNAPVAPNIDVMNSELFYGLGGQTPWEIINSGSETPLILYYSNNGGNGTKSSRTSNNINKKQKSWWYSASR